MLIDYTLFAKVLVIGHIQGKYCCVFQLVYNNHESPTTILPPSSINRSQCCPDHTSCLLCSQFSPSSYNLIHVSIDPCQRLYSSTPSQSLSSSLVIVWRSSCSRWISLLDRFLCLCRWCFFCWLVISL